MAIIFKRKSAAPDASAPSATPISEAAVQLTATDPVALPKPKTILKFGKPPVSDTAAPKPDTFKASMTERQKKALADSGVGGDAPFLHEAVCIGDRVVITNSMFPWVKHYKPGDSAVITGLSLNADPLGLDDGNGHQMHYLNIDQPKDSSRKGQTAALFRWEFEKQKVQASLTGI